jgi:hypothetical protein
MKKTILIGISALVLAITSVVKADISISGYQEFFAGSADQSVYDANSGVPTPNKAGMSNGNFSRLNANYSTTLDSGIEVAGSYTAHARDCQGNRDAICGIVNFNSVAFSGSFGTIGVGEKFDVGAGMLSRMTASGPVAEPDGGMIGHFYTGGAAASYNFGAANEFNYADNSMKITYNSNVYSGFSFAAGYTPNTATEGATVDAAAVTISNDKYPSMTDVVSTYIKYETEMDGVTFQATYGLQTGNAGRVAAVDYNDYDETAYSARIDYANVAVDYRKNEAGNSGQIQNNNAGNDEGTSICAQYIMANIGLGACQLETNFTNTSNQDNSSKTRTYSAEYNLGGGMKLGLVYFDAEQTSNGVTITDADGVVSKLSVGF